MKNWNTLTVGEVCDSISEPFNKKSAAVVLINTSDVFDGKCLNHKLVSNSNLKGQFKKSFRKNDILYSEIRPKNKRYAYIDFNATDYVASTKLMVIRAKPNIINPKFLYHFLKSDIMLEQMQAIAESRSGTFPQITFSELSRIEIQIPNIELQYKVVNYLDNLDNKIELNEKINQNLEAQAQAIFKSWFVDFEAFKNGKFVDSELGNIPEGWRVGRLSDICDITMGQSPSGESLHINSDGTIFFQGRADFGSRFPKNRLYTSEPRRMAKEGSILLSVRAPVGDINIAMDSCCIGRGLASIHSRNQSFLYYLLQSLRRLFDMYNGEGTVFGAINRDSLRNIKILIPKSEIICEFERIANQIDNNIKNNELQSRRLAQLRDTLLPKLMSGEIDVSDVAV